jgi:hypothetical protein
MRLPRFSSTLRTVIERNDGSSGHPVYPSAFPRVDLPSEGTDGSDGDGERGFEYVCTGSRVRTVDEHSYPRASRFAPARGSRTRDALCRYACVRKNLITVGASSLIGQTVVAIVLFSLSSPSVPFLSCGLVCAGER